MKKSNVVGTLKLPVVFPFKFSCSGSEEIKVEKKQAKDPNPTKLIINMGMFDLLTCSGYNNFINYIYYREISPTTHR